MVASNRPDRNQDQRPSWVRFLIGLFKFILLLAVLAVGGFLGFLGWQQFDLVNTRFDLVNTQLDSQNERIDLVWDDLLLENEVKSLIRDQVSTEVDALTAEIDAVEGEMVAIDALEESMKTGLAAQQEEIAALQAEQTALAETLTAVSGDVGTLQSEVSAIIETADQLGQDLAGSTESTGQLERTLTTLENQLSTLESDLASLDARVSVIPTSTVTTTVQAVADEPAETAQDDEPAQETANSGTAAAIDYRVVRLYGMIIRSKVHINEGDLNAAAAILEEAQSAVADLSAGAEGETGDTYASVSENLGTAVESLSDKPTLSNLALDDAWSAMDALLLQLSGN